jgi:2-keto-4-pentenoate hydratase
MSDQPTSHDTMQARIVEAANLLALARQSGIRIPVLPASCRPQSITEAHAVQDAVTARLGAHVTAYKANIPKPDAATSAALTNPNAPWVIGDAVRAPIYATATFASPATVPVSDVPQCGVEGEVAFRFRRALPAREQPYAADDVAAAVEACAAIEAVTSRYTQPDAAPFLDKLADCVSNGGFVHGAGHTDWRSLDFAKIPVTLQVNGTTVVDQQGGHPTGDPFAIVIAFVEAARQASGIEAGLFITCGSYTGLRYLKPGDRCHVAFAGLGSAELTFTAS